MKIGLIDIEPKIFNTAYMQISQYHKQRGDTVEWWSPLTDTLFDTVYCSSLFEFTDKGEVPERAICGGTGYDITSKLSKAIEACEPDYSIYPKCKTSYVWFSRGCDRRCPWCVVHQKEGGIHPVKPKNLNPHGKYVTVMDNNFFANPRIGGVIMAKKSQGWKTRESELLKLYVTCPYCHRKIIHTASVLFPYETGDKIHCEHCGNWFILGEKEKKQ